MNSGQGRSRNWSFTLYNLDAINEVYDADLNVILKKGIKCLVYQHEICPDTGREHIQGVCHTSQSVTRTIFQNYFGCQFHCEPTRNWEASSRYCNKGATRKEGTSPVKCGEEPEQGHRTDLDEMANAIHEGRSIRGTVHLFGGNALRHIGQLCKWQQIVFEPSKTELFAQYRDGYMTQGEYHAKANDDVDTTSEDS
jgi:hypothetical protein